MQQELELETEMAVTKAKTRILDNYDNPTKQPTVTFPYTSTPSQYVAGATGSNPAPSTGQGNDLSRLADLLANRMDNLPRLEPDVFKGDTMQYPLWLKAFETIIEDNVSSPSKRLYYLNKYTAGEAKEAIQGLMHLNTDSAYEDARCLLEERYGNAFEIAEAYREKLRKWPIIKHQDGKELRKFSDILCNCLTAMYSVKYLSVLNDVQANQKLLNKLPRYICERWGRKVDEFLYSEDSCYPSFAVFCDFLKREARIACGPTRQRITASDTRDGQSIGRHRPQGARSFATNVVDDSDVKNSEVKNVVRSQVRTCILCKGPHNLENCAVFLKMSIDERAKIVKSKGLCWSCLIYGHLAKNCKIKQRCEKCTKLHNTLVHDDSYVGKVRALSEANSPKVEARCETEKVVTHKVEVVEQSCCHSLILPVYLHHEENPDNKILVYALLDPQSNSCFISESTLDRVNATGPEVNLELSTMLARNVIQAKKVSGLVITDSSETVNIPLPGTYTRKEIPADHDQIAKPESVKTWPHLKDVVSKLPPYMTDVDIGLLVGMNCPRAIKPRDCIPGENDDPYAIRTDLGWGVIGMVQGRDVPTNTAVCRAVITNDKTCHFAFKTQVKEISSLQIQKMFEADFNERGSEEKVSIEDRKFLKIVHEGIHLRNDGHFEIPLPFKIEETILPNSKPMAVRRLTSLKAKFKKDSKYHGQYTTFIQNMIDKGFAERVPPDDKPVEGKVWYIPHHGVVNPKKPEKLRVVFDCSAGYNGEALNKHLLQGPDMTNNLTGVLCRFRQESVGLTCDIESMFFQVGMNVEHRDYLRFLWWENGNLDTEPVDFRMNVHIFGAASSPGCANFALKCTADMYEYEFSTDSAKFVRQDFYVDDGIKSVETAAIASQLAEASRLLCEKGGFKLHKFNSNDRTVLEGIPPALRAKEVQNIDLWHDELPLERTLGIQWCLESDTFGFRVNVKDKPMTRRGILSTVSSVFDPLGLISPFVLIGKGILQELCKGDKDWDDPVPDGIKHRWERWRSELITLSSLEIPRCYKGKDFGTPQQVEIHHFGDACQYGNGQCSYLRLRDANDNIQTTLVMSKARVLPSKPITIPRLELTAAVMAAKVGSFLQEQLDYDKIEHVYWTDSKVVLGYISNEAKRFNIFVANRVQQIREITSPSDWRYIDSKNNPADIASRGASADELMRNSMWWRGPEFLSTNKNLPEQELITLQDDDPEIKKARVFTSQTKTAGRGDLLDRLKYFSSWHRAKRAIAVCLRFKGRLKDRSVKKPSKDSKVKITRGEMMKAYKPVDVCEIKSAENELIKLVQCKAFQGELQILRRLKGEPQHADRVGRKQTVSIKDGSSLSKLDHFIDDSGLVRVGGRIKRANMSLEVTHPVILPRHSYVTQLLISHYHEKCGHSGRGMTLNAIRASGYWIIAGHTAVTSYVWHCVTCRKLRGANVGQKMADLPEDRLNPSPPFSYSAVDYFGPFCIKEGRRELKRYGVLFTCLASRAIHVETANSLTTDSFLNAYRRFVSRRGPIRQLRTDRGSNFVGAQRELEQALAEMDNNKLRQELLKDNCDLIVFEMNFPYASHMGGIWERQIRSVRNALSSLLLQHGSQLDDELFRTFMAEAEAIVNSRPLTTPDQGSADACEPLSPSQLLTLKSSVLLPPPGVFKREDMYCRRRWRRVQYLAEQFWTRWKAEFLPKLQERCKWKRRQQNLSVDDIVLPVDDSTARCRWPLARVVDTYPSADGLVRKVKIAIGKSEYERPVHKLVLLVSRGIPVEEP